MPMDEGGEEEEDDGDNSSCSSRSTTTPMVADNQSPHTLVVTTEMPRVTEEVFELYKKYQVSVHGDEPEEVTR